MKVKYQVYFLLLFFGVLLINDSQAQFRNSRGQNYPYADEIGTNDVFILGVGIGTAGNTNKNVRYQVVKEQVEQDVVLHGSNNITAGTISSNRLDATAYAAFLGGGSGSAQTNISYTAVTNAPWANTNAPTLFSPKVATLTPGRVVIAGADGLITDDSGLTYDSGSLTNSGSAQIGENLHVIGTANFAAGAASIDANGDAVFQDVTANNFSGNAATATYATSAGNVTNPTTNYPTSPIIEFDFSERGGQLIHNKAERVAPFYSITKPPQGWYAIGGSGTISDSSRSNAFLNPFGDPTATWCNWTGAAQSYLNAGTIVVPRTNLYTASVWVRSNSQTNETWRMNIGGGYTTNFTAYTNWQRFSYPIGLSAGSQNFLPVATTGSSATANLLAWGAQLEAGTMTAVPDWHWDACLGSSPSVETADPAWTNRWLKFSGSQYATLSGVSPLKLQAATVYAVVRFTSSANQNVILATYQQDYQFALGGLAGFRFGAAEATPGSYANWYDNRWHVIAGTSSGTNTLLYIDDIEQTSNYTANGISPLELDKLLLGTVLNGVYLNADLAYLAVHDVAVSRTDYLADLASLQARMFPRVSVSNSSAVVFWEGDSITTSDYSSSFAIRAMTNFPGVRSRNFAVSSSHLASGVESLTLTNRFPNENSLKGLSGTNVLIFLCGANDLLVDSAAELIAETSNYCITARSAGFKVIPGTVISRTALNDTTRNLFNAMLRTNTWYDALADYATNSVMGCDGCSTNLTYFLDGTHPTVAGNTNLTPIAVQALQSIGL